MPIFDDYSALSKDSCALYGQRTLVLYEVGKFFEFYGHDGQGTDVRAVCELLNIQATRKDKSKPESPSNPAMGGFPNLAFDKYTPLLLEANYTVVKAEQQGQSGCGVAIRREVTCVQSKGTACDASASATLRAGAANNLVAVYVEKVHPHVSVGVASVDLSTGRTHVFETSVARAGAPGGDAHLAWDELHRVATVLAPREVLIVGLADPEELRELAAHAGLPAKFHARSMPEVARASYQDEVLRRAFPSTGLLTPAEFCNLERTPYALAAFVAVLRFAYEHDRRVVAGLARPERIDGDNAAVISFNAMRQLDVVGGGDGDAPGSKGGLLGLLNRCTTPMGARLFRERLLCPVACVKQLEERYDFVDRMLAAAPREQQPRYEAVRRKLEAVGDLERTWRRVQLGRTAPSELAVLADAAAAAQAAVELGGGCGAAPSAALGALEALGAALEDSFDVAGAAAGSATPFARGRHPDLDAMQDALRDAEAVFAEVRDALNAIAGADHFRVETDGQQQATWLVVTAKRWAAIKPRLADRADAVRGAMRLAHLAASQAPGAAATATYVRVAHPSFGSMHARACELRADLEATVRERYADALRALCAAHDDGMVGAVAACKALDVAAACAYNAATRRYVRPTLVEQADGSGGGGRSWLRAERVRHPLIEAIRDDIPHVPNDVSLGTDGVHGMLLYGLNAAGKSSLMKAVGLSVVLAQAGMFVPCSSLELRPFRQVFTRVGLRDDLYRGHSTFMVEMLELRNILRRADASSLVIGDELCASTEAVSALSIVGAGVVTLHALGAAFLFATHLHAIKDMAEVAALEGLAVRHLACSIDERSGKIVYERVLRKGTGPPIYGISVCRGLDMDPAFLATAERIRAEIMGEPRDLVRPRQSRYNARVYVDACSMCGRPADETHHVREQREADAMGFIDGHLRKNARHNLAPLCEACHLAVHRGEARIGGYQQTSEGVQLSVEEGRPAASASGSSSSTPSSSPKKSTATAASSDSFNRFARFAMGSR